MTKLVPDASSGLSKLSAADALQIKTVSASTEKGEEVYREDQEVVRYFKNKYPNKYIR